MACTDPGGAGVLAHALRGPPSLRLTCVVECSPWSVAHVPPAAELERDILTSSDLRPMLVAHAGHGRRRACGSATSGPAAACIPRGTGRPGRGQGMTSNAEFEEFSAGAVGRLLGQLLPVTGDLHEAEEVVQEAFARAFVHWSRLRDHEVPRGLGAARGHEPCRPSTPAGCGGGRARSCGPARRRVRRRSRSRRWPCWWRCGRCRSGSGSSASPAGRRRCWLLSWSPARCSSTASRAAWASPARARRSRHQAPRLFPDTGKVRTDQPAAGTPEHRLLRNMTPVLNRCRGGDAPELIGWVRSHGFVVMAAAPGAPPVGDCRDAP
jgi:hypothetical protein